jgi:YD repeat-containing protein
VDRAGGRRRQDDRFQYYASGPAAGQLWRVTHPVVGADTARETLEYDARGNLRLVRSPTGLLTVIERDGWGRDTLVITPLRDTVSYVESTLRTTGVRQRTEYDVMDRPRVSETIAPALVQRTNNDQSWTYTPPASPEERLRVETFYDAVGRVESVTRQVWPDSGSVNLIVTDYFYDRAGRKRIESGSQGAPQHFEYDMAGNVIEARTATRPAVTMEYDVLGRLVRRSVPERSYQAQSDQNYIRMWMGLTPDTFPKFPNAPAGAYLVPAEETHYRYDAAGNQVYAQNADAIVRRSYFPSGALRGDTLQLRDYGTPSYSTSYGLEYAYDVAGRVVSLKHPQNLAEYQNLDQYFYDGTTGALSGMTNREGLAFTFEYDAQGRPTVTTAPGSVRDSVGYDLESRRTWHRLRNASGLLMQETMQYDVRSKLVRAENGASTFQQWYSGLGNLVATDWQAIGTLYRNAEEYVIDPLGNVTRTRTANGEYGWDALGSEPRINRYEGGQGRIVETKLVPPAIVNSGFNQDSTTYTYDVAGNLSYEYRQAAIDNTTGAATISETRHFYGGDERLRVLQRVSLTTSDGGLPITRGGVWEEYRYDPLGRRVLVRTRTDGNLCNDPNRGRARQASRASSGRATRSCGSCARRATAGRMRTWRPPRRRERVRAGEPQLRGRHRPAAGDHQAGGGHRGPAPELARDVRDGDDAERSCERGGGQLARVRDDALAQGGVPEAELVRQRRDGDAGRVRADLHAEPVLQPGYGAVHAAGPDRARGGAEQLRVRGGGSGYVLALGLFAVVTACVPGEYPECPSGYGQPSMLERRAVDPDEGLLIREVGSLVVRVSLGVAGGEPMDNVLVTLQPGTRAFDMDRDMYRQRTNFGGLAQFDSISQGAYSLQARRVGSEPFQTSVQIRTGYQDSLFVMMRAQPLCL